MLPVLLPRQAAPNPAAPNRWMTWIESSINKMIVPTFLHVPIGSFLQCCFPTCRHSLLVVVQFFHVSYSHIFPILPFWLTMLHVSFLFDGYSTFPLCLLPNFSHHPILVCNVFFFYLCNYYNSDFPRWFPNNQCVFNCESFSPLGFCFFNTGGGADLIWARFLPPTPPPPAWGTQEVPPSIGPADPPLTSMRHT